MKHVISVRPAPDGWMVASSGAHVPLHYARATEAEDAALEIAEDLASEGQPTEVHIHLLDGAMAAKFVCAPYGKPVVQFIPATRLSRVQASLAA
jgi:hypothetical protein